MSIYIYQSKVKYKHTWSCQKCRSLQQSNINNWVPIVCSLLITSILSTVFYLLLCSFEWIEYINFTNKQYSLGLSKEWHTHHRHGSIKFIVTALSLRVYFSVFCIDFASYPPHPPPPHTSCIISQIMLYSRLMLHSFLLFYYHFYLSFPYQQATGWRRRKK